jgi:hypothetical protein
MGLRRTWRSFKGRRRFRLGEAGSIRSSESPGCRTTAWDPGAGRSLPYGATMVERADPFRMAVTELGG